ASFGRVPKHHFPILCTANQESRRGDESQLPHFVSVSLQKTERLARPKIPNAYRLIPARGCQGATVRKEHHRAHPGTMAPQDIRLSSRGHIPDPNITLRLSATTAGSE